MAQNNKKQVFIKFVVPPQLKAGLARLARTRNISLSALLRLIASEYIKQKGGHDNLYR